MRESRILGARAVCLCRAEKTEACFIGAFLERANRNGVSIVALRRPTGPSMCHCAYAATAPLKTVSAL
jgi:hypothetical protein